MTIDQINALNRFALAHKRGWKRLLERAWERVNYPVSTTDADKALLQQLRNNGGPTLLSTFKTRAEGYRKVGYLQQAHRECITYRGARTVLAWRIVTEAGDDMVQPWCEKKGEARDLADTLGIFLAERTQ